MCVASDAVSQPRPYTAPAGHQAQVLHIDHSDLPTRPSTGASEPGRATRPYSPFRRSREDGVGVSMSSIGGESLQVKQTEYKYFW